MGRSPLFRRLQALAADFAEAERSGRSVESLQEERKQNRVSRRDFLKVAGATVGAAALSARIPAFAAGRTPRIAVIGAGIAGLNAALTLQDAGYASTVFEATNRVGGRMHSDTTTWLNGQTSEDCGELIDSAHTAILGLAQRFGLEVVDLHAAEPIGSTETYFFGDHYYTAAQANADFHPVFRRLTTDNNAAPFPTLYNSFTAAGRELDRMTVYDWIESRVPGGHQSRMGRLLDVAYNIEYGNVTTEQSALNIVYLLYNTNQFVVFGASDERYHVKGGNERIPKAIANVLTPGSVQLNTALTAIVLNGDGSYTLTLNRGGRTFSQKFDRVIMTIPFSVLRTLDYSAAGFDLIKRTAITELGYGRNAKLQLQFDSRLWNARGPWGLSTGTSYSDTGYQNSWDVTRAQNGETGILVDYTGGGVPLASFNGNPDDPSVVAAYARTFLTQLEAVFPGISELWNGRATLDVPHREPFLRGSYSYWKPGQYTLFSGYEGARQPDPTTGRCHFAGEHCSTNFQGFMEGGAEEGARAANEILSDYAAGIFP